MPSKNPESTEFDRIRREVMHFAGIGIFRYTFDGRILFLDEGAFRIFELGSVFGSAEAVVGTNVAGLVKHVVPVGSVRERLRREGRIHDLEYPFVTLSGVQKWVTHYTYTIKDPNSGDDIIQATIQDITERKHMEQALRESEERYRHLVENASDIIYQTDTLGRITYGNPVATRVTGYTLHEILGRPVYELVRPDLRDEARAARERQLLERIPSVYSEFPAVTKHGNIVWFGQRVELILKGNEPIGFQAVARDITPQKQTEEALREALQRFEYVIENTPLVAIQGFDRNGVVLHWNNASERLYGYRASEAIGRKLGELLLSPQDANEFELLLSNLWESPRPLPPREWSVRTRSGKERWVYSSTFPVLYQGEVTEVFCMDVDVTERRRAEQALRASEEKYRELVQNANSIILRRRPDGVITFFNEYAQEFFGYREDEILGQNVIGTIVAPTDSSGKDLAAMIRAIGATPERYAVNENENIRRNGERVWVAWTNRAIRDGKGEVVEILCIGNDITKLKRAEEERRNLEMQVQQTQKLESLGVLAGGVAHDFNNLLVGVLGYAEMALMSLPEGAPARDSIVQIEKSARRAAELTRQLLAYAGRGKFVIEPANLSEIVREMSQLLEVSISKKATLEISLDPTLPLIEADATQIRQLVMNLITNASDAIGDECGVIRISTSVVNCDRACLHAYRSDVTLGEGRYVTLRVADSGCGMNKETLDRIFDPFFTTKFIGRGLGLAAVMGIVRGHRGGIRVESKPGKGTVFEILIPVSDRGSPQTEGVGNMPDWEGSGVVLVVDDEAAVRELSMQFLEMAGFRVLTASDGREGVAVFKEHAGEIVLVLLDMSMPKMSGEEAFIAMRNLNQDVRVLLSSGYCDAFDTDHFGGGRLAGFIQKPYTMNELLTKVSEALEK